MSCAPPSARCSREHRSQPRRARFQTVKNLSRRLFIEGIGIRYLDGTIVHRTQPDQSVGGRPGELQRLPVVPVHEHDEVRPGQIRRTDDSRNDARTDRHRVSGSYARGVQDWLGPDAHKIRPNEPPDHHRRPAAGTRQRMDSDRCCRSKPPVPGGPGGRPDCASESRRAVTTARWHRQRHVTDDRNLRNRCSASTRTPEPSPSKSTVAPASEQLDAHCERRLRIPPASCVILPQRASLAAGVLQVPVDAETRLEPKTTLQDMEVHSVWVRQFRQRGE